MDFATDHLEEVIISRDKTASKARNRLGDHSLTMLPSLLVKRKEAADAGNDTLVVQLDGRIDALRATYRRR
ncbi:MAG: hypothetical protein KI792_02995 [Alphaproteobacteria bacterium]|nr:hypothetical protein [Alphaproteobacteria bacterium SS10]